MSKYVKVSEIIEYVDREIYYHRNDRVQTFTFDEVAEMIRDAVESGECIEIDD